MDKYIIHPQIFRFLLNHSEMSEQLSRAKAQLEKLKVAEEKKAKTIIKAMQQKVDEAAKKMANRNAEHQKQKQELEIENSKLALEKYPKKSGQLKEKYQKEIAELEAKNLEENAYFAKEMNGLKEQLKEKINWNQVDLVMGKYLAISPIASAKGDCWDSANTTNSNSISTDGLNSCNATGFKSISANIGFIISAVATGPPSLFYFEVTQMSLSYRQIHVGLSSENIPNGSVVGELPNSYAIQYGRAHCWLSGSVYPFEWPNGAIKPKWNGCGDVIGCGLLLNTANEFFIFFTGNGLLMGKQIPINPTANTLYPTVTFEGNGSIEANFGNDLVAKPFKYDIKKCPGMVMVLK